MRQRHPIEFISDRACCHNGTLPSLTKGGLSRQGFLLFNNHEVKRNPQLWALIMAIVKRDKVAMRQVFENNKIMSPQIASKHILQLITSSKGKLPDNPIGYALWRAADTASLPFSADGNLDYLYCLIERRYKVAQLTAAPHADNPAVIDAKIRAEAEPLGLASFVDFVLEEQKAQKTQQAPLSPFIASAA